MPSPGDESVLGIGPGRFNFGRQVEHGLKVGRGHRGAQGFHAAERDDLDAARSYGFSIGSETQPSLLDLEPNSTFCRGLVRLRAPTEREEGSGVRAGFTEFPGQSAPADAQRLGGLGFVAAVFLEDPLDMSLFHFFQGQAARRLVPVRAEKAEIVGRDHAGAADHHRPFDHVAQFPHVAGQS